MTLRLRERYYTSVSEFSTAFSAVISERLLDNAANKDTSGDIEAISTHLNELKPGTAQHSALTQEQKDIKRLAKRILKAVKEPLEDAVRKEAELKGLERDEVMKRLDALPIFAATKALELETDPSPIKKSSKHRRSASDVSAVPGASPDDEEMLDADADAAKEEAPPRRTGKKSTPTSEAPGSRASSRHSKSASLSKLPPVAATEPISPPTSSASSADSSAEPADVGGVPWYLEHFDPVGTTLHEERYTGREVLRGMSEELSDMDEDTLTELQVGGSFAEAEGLRRSTRGQVAAALASGVVEGGKRRPRKKGKRSQWSKGRGR